MTTKNEMLILLGIVITLLPVHALAQDASAVLSASIKAMGAENLQSLQYSGGGFSFVFAQAARPGGPWPRFSVKNYTRQINFGAPASHVQLVRTAVDKRGGGGVGIPIVDQTQNQFILPNAAWAQQVDIWITPSGFLKAAMANMPTVKTERVGGSNYSVVTFMGQKKYTVRGYINDQNLVEKVETWLEHAAVGDLLIEASYSAYKDFGGLKFPTRIIQSQGGFPVLDLTVTDVKPNAAVDIQAPQRGGGGGGGGGAAAGGGAQGAMVRSIEVTDGVYYIIGGPNNTIAVEFRDYIVMIEAPQNEERSMAFIAEARKQIPNKPIRYIINTHHHFDHSGGLRAFAAEGATIVTHQINKPYLEKALMGPRTLAPDQLSKSGKKMVFETLGDKKVLTDGTRTIEVHLVKDSPHTDGTVMAYLPNEKLLVEADIFDMPGPGVPGVTEGPNTAANLVDNIERLKLSVERLLPVHAADVVPLAELYKAAKR
jgi:glyoxylase-like metal-dependent hydrolase (beta-lactamase superfamily II)